MTEPSTTLRTGFVGLGVMGRPMATRLLAAGFPTTVTSRTAAAVQELVRAGATAAATPGAVALASDVVLVMVPETADLEAVMEPPDGVLGGAHEALVIVAMGTHDPSAMPRLAARAAAVGAAFLDAPVSGGDVGAREGTLSIMVGGDETAFERAKPVLLAIGPKVTRIGGNGLACQMKIAVNLLLMVEVICFGEAVALAEKGGVEREVAVDAILKSVAASPVLGYRGPFIIDGKMPAVPLADVTLQQKDMMLALNLGRKLGSPVPLAAAANEMMNACRGLGIDANDFVVAHQVYRRLGGQG